MPTFRVPIDGHEVEIRASSWTCRESVFLDGVEVSRTRSGQFATSHGFVVVEKSGERVVFEAQVLGGFRIGFALRRNGILIAASPRNELAGNTFDPVPSDTNWSGPADAS
jgi:hypothetical protein